MWNKKLFCVICVCVCVGGGGEISGCLFACLILLAVAVS